MGLCNGVGDGKNSSWPMSYHSKCSEMDLHQWTTKESLLLMCGSQGYPQTDIQSGMLLRIGHEMHSFVLHKNLLKNPNNFVQFYVSVLSGQKSQIWFLSLHEYVRMVWYKNVLYSCKISGLLLPLPVVLMSMRHSVTDSWVLGEETMRSSSLSGSELQASKFYLQISYWSLSLKHCSLLTSTSTKCEVSASVVWFWSCSLHSAAASYPTLICCVGHGSEMFHLSVFTAPSLYWITQPFQILWIFSFLHSN